MPRSRCLGHDVECLWGPCCPRGVSMVVLRGSGPSLSGLPPSRFFNQNLHPLSDDQNIIQGPQKPTKMSPKTIPHTRKTRNSQNMKCFKNHCIYCGLGTSSPHFSTTWPSKTHADADTPTYLQISSILLDFGCPWGVQGWTREPRFWSHFRLCPFRRSPGGHRLAKRPPRAPK